ncbi:MAG: DUF2927 domain-containing protein [Eubacteriales bacterium]|nr:DUF2927 domain-containing protein [Eubacteriales bacterium]
MNKLSKNFKALLALLLSLTVVLALGGCEELKLEPKQEVENTEEQESQELEQSFYARRADLDSEFLQAGIERYAKLALYTETDPETASLKRWESRSIPIILEGKYTPEDQAYLEALMAELNELDNFPQLELATELSPESIEIQFGEPLALAEIYGTGEAIENFLWFINWKSEPSFELFLAKLGVNSEQDLAGRKADLCHGLLPLFGLYNSEFRADDSALAYAATETELSQLDKLVLEMHYRPELEVGMPVKAAVQLLRELYLDEQDLSESGD